MSSDLILSTTCQLLFSYLLILLIIRGSPAPMTRASPSEVMTSIRHRQSGA